eukprot:SAG11_NODE_754_length_7332_cov_5.256325_3_plen_89_part_00
MTIRFLRRMARLIWHTSRYPVGLRDGRPQLCAEVNELYAGATGHVDSLYILEDAATGVVSSVRLQGTCVLLITLISLKIKILGARSLM